MPDYLEVDYVPSASWCHPILAVLNNCPALSLKHAVWAKHRLSDLAFAITGRLAALGETIRFVDENLHALDRALTSDPSVPSYVGSYAYTFYVDDEEAIRRVLIGAS